MSEHPEIVEITCGICNGSCGTPPHTLSIYQNVTYMYEPNDAPIPIFSCVTCYNLVIEGGLAWAREQAKGT